MKASRPFRYDLNQIPYYYTVEVTNRFKGLDLIECLGNKGWRFITLHRKWSESLSVMSNSLWPHGLYTPWNSPGQNTKVGSLSLPQGIFPTQGSNPGLPFCRQILHQLSHKESPRILEWVAYPFSSGHSQPRNSTRVSCTAGRFFTNWAIRKAPQRLRQTDTAQDPARVTLSNCVCVSGVPRNAQNPKISMAHRLWIVLSG